MAALTRSGASKASEIVMLTFRALQPDAAHHSRYNRPAFPGGSNEVKIDKTATTQSSQRQRYNYVYCATYCAADRHRRLHLDVVGDLDTGSMRKRTPYFEQGQRYT